MTNNNSQSTQQDAENQTKVAEYAITLSAMIKKVENEPKPRLIYSGVKEKSMGIVFGPSKSGKTMFCENLGMSIAAGLSEYLGMPINIENRKVLMISMEEDHINRTDRNIKQVEKLKSEHGEAWLENFIVAGVDMPRYISTGADWEILKSVIIEHNPGVVILDSITRMCQGIEESAVAQTFMKNLRHLTTVTNTTLFAIHHTTKMFGQSITFDHIAGSRVVAQELDFAIGINKTQDGKRYIKDVFFRHAPDDREKVTTFEIDEHCWVNAVGDAYEGKLIAAIDGRQDNRNGDKIHAYLAAKPATEHAVWGELEAHFVTTKVMSRGTLGTHLKKLESDGKIVNTGGQYKVTSS